MVSNGEEITKIAVSFLGEISRYWEISPSKKKDADLTTSNIELRVDLDSVCPVILDNVRLGYKIKKTERSGR